jgi:hypothetical protein
LWIFKYIVELCHLRLLQAHGRLCIFLLLNSRFAVTDIVVPKGCSITRKCIGDGGLILLGFERIVVNGRDCLSPVMLEKQTEYMFRERGKGYLSVRTTLVNRHRATWHDIQTHVAEPGLLL